MTKVVLKGLAARPLRTALSALAIVVGVAFVCAALTFTGAMRGAADSLSSAAYDGTDAVVTAKSAFEPGTDSFAQKPTLPAATLDEVRGDGRRRRRRRRHLRHGADHGPRRRAARRRAVLRLGLRRPHAGRRAS